MNRVQKIVDRIPVRRALVSVSDKSSLETLAEALVGIDGIEILSTGGTYARLQDLVGDRARLTRVSDYTGQPETQGGLVKTLDFRIYVGLLSEPFNRSHDQDRERLGTGLIDMVVVNLYPFADITSRDNTDGEDARSNIDIGGPTMLRASAKSFLRVASVCDPSDYASLSEELAAHDGTLSLETRYRLAKKAFRHTATYDATIAEYLEKQDYAAARTPYEVVNE